MVTLVHPDFHAKWIEWESRAQHKLSYLTLYSLGPQHAESALVIGARNDSLEASQNPEVSLWITEEWLHCGRCQFSLKHIVLHLILWKLVIPVWSLWWFCINQNIRLTRTLCSLPGLYNGKFAEYLLSLSGLTDLKLWSRATLFASNHYFLLLTSLGFGDC